MTWNGTGGGGTPRRSDFNALIDTNVNTVSAGANGAQKFYVDGNLVAVSRDAITDSTAKSYYAKFLEYSGKPDMWNTNLSYFCYGKNMDKATFDGRISNATVNGSNASNNSTVTVSSDSATVTFTNQLKRNDGVRLLVFMAVGKLMVVAKIRRYSPRTRAGFLLLLLWSGRQWIFLRVAMKSYLKT